MKRHSFKFILTRKEIKQYAMDMDTHLTEDMVDKIVDELETITDTFVAEKIVDLIATHTDSDEF